MRENGLIGSQKSLLAVFIFISVTLIFSLNSKAASVSCQKAMIVEEDQTICDTSIEKDVYIKQGVTLITAGTVTIEGNVYVWGTLNNTGYLTVTDTLYCLHYGSMMSAGNYDYGYFTNSGSAKITSLNVTSGYLSSGFPMISHTSGSWDVTKEATCTTAGEQVQRCLYCNEILNTSTIAATGHNYNDGTVTKAATATLSGIRTYTCKKCGATKTETIPATGSAASNSGSSGSSNSNSSSSGTSSSGSSNSSSSITLKKGSTYISGNFKYKIITLPASGNGTVRVTGPASTLITTAAIPAKVTIGGKTFKVTEIGAKAFKGCKKLTTVSTGKNVTVIGNQAFQGCTNMTGVSIQVNTTAIGKKVFYNCQKLKKIVIKSKQLTSVGKNTFKGIKSNATIKVPASKLKAYTKLLKGKGQGSKVKVTG